MPTLRLLYRDRQYVCSIRADVAQLAALDFHWLQQRNAFQRGSWSHGQIDTILEAFQVLYGTGLPLNHDIQLKLRHQYHGHQLSLSVPHFFSFNATVAFQSFLLVLAAHEPPMSLADAKLQLKNLVMVGSDAVPAFRALQKMWTPPPSIPLPCPSFSSLGRSLASCQELLQGRLTSKHFEHLWATLWASASLTLVLLPIRCEAYGQRFTFWPRRSTALEASLRNISLQLNLPPTIAAFNVLWANLKTQYEGQPGETLPEEQLFCPAKFDNYIVAPASLAPIHYKQEPPCQSLPATLRPTLPPLVAANLLLLQRHGRNQLMLRKSEEPLKSLQHVSGLR